MRKAVEQYPCEPPVYHQHQHRHHHHHHHPNIVESATRFKDFAVYSIRQAPKLLQLKSRRAPKTWSLTDKELDGGSIVGLEEKKRRKKRGLFGHSLVYFAWFFSCGDDSFFACILSSSLLLLLLLLLLPLFL
jgi:hypothetical protein